MIRLWLLLIYLVFYLANFLPSLIPFSFAEEGLGLWSELLIKYEFLVDMSLHRMLRIHLLSLVNKQHVLALARVEADLTTECICIASIVLEKHN